MGCAECGNTYTENVRSLPFERSTMRGVDRSLKARRSEGGLPSKARGGPDRDDIKRSGPFSIRVGFGWPDGALQGAGQATRPAGFQPALSHAIRGARDGPMDCHTPPLPLSGGEGDLGSVTVGPQVHEAGPSRTRDGSSQTLDSLEPIRSRLGTKPRVHGAWSPLHHKRSTRGAS